MFGRQWGGVADRDGGVEAVSDERERSGLVTAVVADADTACEVAVADRNGVRGVCAGKDRADRVQPVAEGGVVHVERGRVVIGWSQLDCVAVIGVAAAGWAVAVAVAADAVVAIAAEDDRVSD